MTAARVALRILVFLAIFVIEIRVKAAESVRLPPLAPSEVTQLPRECLKNPVDSCAVATFDHQKYLLELGEAKIWLDQNTSVVRVAPGDAQVKGQIEVRLLKGTVWVQSKVAVRVSTGFGAFFYEATGDDKVDSEGSEFWVRREGERAVGACIHHRLQLQARSSLETLVVPEGLENWIGRVGEHGEAKSGVPLPLSFTEHISRWARLFPGKKKDFEAEVEKFHAAWVRAAQLSADIHQKQFERRIASIPDPKLAAATPEVKKSVVVDRRQRFNEAINALFRHKFFSGE